MLTLHFYTIRLSSVSLNPRDYNVIYKIPCYNLKGAWNVESHYV